MKKTTQPAYTPQTLEDDDGRYECDIYGDWIGWQGPRRTMLKRGLELAKADVRAGRFVCPCWPDCRHRAPA